MAEQKSVSLFCFARVGPVDEDIAIGAEDLLLIYGPIKLNKTTSTARHCRDVSSEFCCPEALSRADEPRHSLYASA